jgi:hypothetical protein
MEGEAALDCIQENYSPGQTLGYDTARDTLYAKIDSGSEGHLTGVYSGYTITLTPGEDPSQDAYSKDINAEHVFPQSKGAGSEPQTSDMHNLRPAREQVNSARGNVPFGESPDAQTDTWYFEDKTRTSAPTSSIDAWTERLGQSAFEPREAREGDIARSALYFYAVYQSAADDAFFEGMKDQLIEWHEADPVTAAERARSGAIAQRQGNENPFVLDSTLAGRAFSGGGGSDEPPTAGGNGKLYISELSDAAGDYTTEFFEIYNDSSGAVDLAGIDGKIVQDYQNGGQVYVFDFGADETSACESTVVPGNGILVVARGATQAEFEAEWGTLPSEANFCAFNSGSFYPGTNERSWELRAGGTSNEPGDGDLLDSSPQFTQIEGGRAYQDLSRDTPWAEGEPVGAATPGVLDSGQVLPVELAGFGARLQGRKAVLTWQVTSETQNAGFRVQRSAREEGDGTWTTVGVVQGAGTTTEATSYRYVDEDLPYEADRLTYRLKQVDMDGSASYSEEVTVEQAAEETELLGTYPNPAQSRAAVRYVVPGRQDVKIHLYDLLGRRVQTVVDGRREGRHERQLDVSRLASGVYFLRLHVGGQTQKQKLTIVR